MSGRHGSTLIELLVAVVLTCIAFLSIFSVIGGGARTTANLDCEEAVDVSLRAAADALAPYVTADAGVETADQAPGGSWSLPGATGCSTTWALASDCEHDASRFIAPLVKLYDPDARLTYTVTAGLPDVPRRVQFSLQATCER